MFFNVYLRGYSRKELINFIKDFPLECGVSNCGAMIGTPWFFLRLYQIGWKNEKVSIVDVRHRTKTPAEIYLEDYGTEWVPIPGRVEFRNGFMLCDHEDDSDEELMIYFPPISEDGVQGRSSMN